MSDDQPDVETRYQEMDEKLILMQMLAELQAIRQAVTDDETDTDRRESQRESVEAQQKYQCDKCRREVARKDRWDHARERHKAPPDQVPHMFDAI
jgi:hypothetical protein